MSVISRIALALVIIGALNWGLIGFFEFDLVASIFGGQTSAFARVVYALVGLSGIACIPLLFAQEDEQNSTSSSKDGNRQAYRNLSYDTEFAEEEEIIVAADPQTKASTGNSTTNPQSNYYKKTSKKKKK
ncbi:DUF378 domain-containing protein [Psychrobacillus sp. NPDC093200]|uniref:DUF378 domain-containing protein n=1 Tax=Psychrobacillus sp. NPDC093200 TaxID=3390656 RepID=UPI003D070D4A